jgi:GTP-binding protein HflX
MTQEPQTPAPVRDDWLQEQADRQWELDSQVSERAGLRRVAGLSTELEDISEVEVRQVRLERVVLVGVWTSGGVQDAEASLAELAALAQTAGSVVLDGLIQRRETPDPATYIGKGKAGELARVVAELGADTVICDGELTPGQLRQLEAVVKVKVVDRTWLILDIFAQHAKSREGKAQVSLAQLQYLLPRLRGWGDSLSRQAGGRVGAGAGIGTRGPGETKLEMDRRRIRSQISRLRKQIAEMGRARHTQRKDRMRHELPTVALAGYTNAGKSSLMNRITGASVLVEDALFATLDPTVRRAATPTGRPFALVDTVGFVRHLPHGLVDAFRSTLEETIEADVLIHVVDAADPDPLGQIAAVREVLGEIGATGMPEVIAFNKADIADPATVQALLGRHRGSVAVSALTGEGVPDLLAAVEAVLPRPNVPVHVLLPYDRGDLVSDIHSNGEVRTVAYGEAGTSIEADVPAWLAAAVEPFSVTA